MEDLSEITRDDIENGIVGSGPILFGDEHPVGSLKGKPPELAGREVCDLLSWIRDNSNCEVWPSLRFRPNKIELGWEVVRKSDGVVVKTFAYDEIRGSINGLANTREVVEQLFKRMIIKVIQKIQA